ncbi:aldo/keto reductase [Plasticicumulans acidivorans]|uniref:Diketogulonate reductase-like aldo/keto reductase n=1 Tax=Plasticicumulans acidivorans TaxID=886464 RepID=A0A317MWI1_9GAMM|nr:aldo/keto reductase [Plasticicumulans acidivorans]PWV63171.1 diketogulonate reductase-like aldo/keto reductase [Plasticicumulans acidivorans]
MKYVTLPDGEHVPALGMGTWRMGERHTSREAEIAALQYGIDLGLTLIDTAEMYGDGGAEEVVGAALRGRRGQVFLVSKVYPHNATRHGTITACEHSLRRLGVDCIDLYLLHWPGATPLAETVTAFEQLQRDGSIRHWGVSNLDIGEMAELATVAGGARCATDQVLYNLSRRGVEWDLLPWCREHGMPLMAYSPVEQARLLEHAPLQKLARGLGMSPAQLALAWLLSREQVIAIPKAGALRHLDDNRAALDVTLTADTLAELDRLFPPPRRASPLAML